MKTVLNMFSKHIVEVLVDLLRMRLQNQDCSRSLGSGHLSVSKSGVFDGGYAWNLKTYVEEGKLIRNKQMFQHHVHLEHARDKFGLSDQMQIRFMLKVLKDDMA